MNIKRGDTLIEVMFAVSVFAAMMVGALAIMNGGYARTMASLQITMARNAMDSQAEALRYLNSSVISNPATTNPNVALWRNAVGRGGSDADKKKTSASDLNHCPTEKSQIDGLNGFFLNTSTEGNLRYSQDIFAAQTFPQIVGDQAQGLWVETVPGVGYYDFHIRACWIAPGNQAPTTLGTIVRLYAPTN